MVHELPIYIHYSHCVAALLSHVHLLSFPCLQSSSQSMALAGPLPSRTPGAGWCWGLIWGSAAQYSILSCWHHLFSQFKIDRYLVFPSYLLLLLAVWQRMPLWVSQFKLYDYICRIHVSIWNCVCGQRECVFVFWRHYQIVFHEVHSVPTAPSHTPPSNVWKHLCPSTSS